MLIFLQGCWSSLPVCHYVHANRLCVFFSVPVPAWPRTSCTSACGGRELWPIRADRPTPARGRWWIGCCVSRPWSSWGAAAVPVATRWRRSYRSASCLSWNWRTCARHWASCCMDGNRAANKSDKHMYSLGGQNKLGVFGIPLHLDLVVIYLRWGLLKWYENGWWP